MLGIGLGGFAHGFEKGIGIGEKLVEGQNRRAISSGIDEGRAEYDKEVAEGRAQPNDADAILRFTMPKIMGPLLRTGDLRQATAASEWLRSDTTRRGADLFGKGMIAAQAGDVRGALDHFVSAGRIKGYGGDYEIADPQALPGGGWRVGITRGGKTFSQDFKSPDDVMRFGSTYLNPQAAFEARQAERSADTTAARGDASDARRYGARKGIDLEHEQRRQTLGLGTGGQAPADVRTSEWLVQRGIAKTPQEAWDLVRRSRSSQETIAAQIMGRAMTPQQGRRNLEEYYKLFPDQRPPGMPAPAAPPAAPAQQPGFIDRFFGGGASSAPAQPPAQAPAQQRPEMMTRGDGGRPVTSVQPPGAGSRQQPFAATAQEHVEWFKQRAPAGSVISIDGRLYTK